MLVQHPGRTQPTTTGHFNVQQSHIGPGLQGGWQHLIPIILPFRFRCTN